MKANKFGVQQSKKPILPNDLGLDPMTSVLKGPPDMVKMYQHTKSEVSMLRHSKVIPKQTHRHETITFPHTRVVIKTK